MGSSNSREDSALNAMDQNEDMPPELSTNSDTTNSESNSHLNRSNSNVPEAIPNSNSRTNVNQASSPAVIQNEINEVIVISDEDEEQTPILDVSDDALEIFAESLSAENVSPPSPPSLDQQDEIKSEISGVQQDPTGINNMPIQDRLHILLRCPVCLDLADGLSIYQCKNGHLMCADCLHRLLADALLDDCAATCPTCRCDVSEGRGVTRNHAAEQLAAEMPQQCDACGAVMRRSDFKQHTNEECPLRLVPCKYAAIGCDFTGPDQDKEDHEASCEHQHKSGQEIIDFLRNCTTLQETPPNTTDMLNFLSLGDTVTHDLRLKSYVDELRRPKLYYQTSRRFRAWDIDWRLTVNIESHLVPFNHGTRRYIKYRLDARGSHRDVMAVTHLLTSDPDHPLPGTHMVHRDVFSENSSSSDYYEIKMSLSECNGVIANNPSSLYVRLMMAKSALSM